MAQSLRKPKTLIRWVDVAKRRPPHAHRPIAHHIRHIAINLRLRLQSDVIRLRRLKRQRRLFDFALYRTYRRRKPISTLQPSPAFVRRGYGATISPPTRYAHITTQTTPLGSATRPNTRQIRHKTTSIFRGVAMHPCAALSKYRRATPAITARRRPKRGSR